MLSSVQVVHFQSDIYSTLSPHTASEVTWLTPTVSYGRSVLSFFANFSLLLIFTTSPGGSRFVKNC
jgi:hypothetical protein